MINEELGDVLKLNGECGQLIKICWWLLLNLKKRVVQNIKMNVPRLFFRSFLKNCFATAEVKVFLRYVENAHHYLNID